MRGPAMRTALLWVSGLAALVFAAAFLGTFLLRDYLTGLAQEFVIDRTRAYADQVVAAADRAVNVPGVQRFLKADQVDAARLEIAAYRADPRGYIAGLVAGNSPAVTDPGPGAAVADQLLYWKAQVRGHFDRTMDRLMFDLRIFFGTNLAVALVTAACAWRARGRMFVWLVPAAVLLVVSLGFSAYMYVDGFTYFTILTNSYLGWGYPRLLGLVFLFLLLRFGRPLIGLTAAVQAETARGRK